MTKAIIFDLDGTLLDSDPYWQKSDGIVAKKLNFTPTKEFYAQLQGRGIIECAQLYIDTFNLVLSVDEFLSLRMKCLYEILFKNLTFMPYAKDLLDKLKAQNFTLAVATAGHSKEKTQEILEGLSVLDYFTVVSSGLEVKHSKPAPRSIFIRFG